MYDVIDLAVTFGSVLVLMVVGYLAGGHLERRHLASLRYREHQLRGITTVTSRSAPKDWTVVEAGLVTGSVVVSVDYFKRILAGLRFLVGGPVRSYETLVARGRREALLRLKERTRRQGFHAVINVRIETSCLASSGQEGKGLAGVEVLAYGTAVKLSL
jgi:uncharacterized protein YbjQ (UPF0145 family)